MKSKQILSIEQMKHLRDLGMDTSGASMLYCDLYDEEYILVESKHQFDKEENAILLEGVRNSVIYCKKVTPTYTLQDILDMLPKEISNGVKLHIEFDNDGMWEVSYMGRFSCIEYFCEKKLVDAAYKMLCWVWENAHKPTQYFWR